ncbi:pyridine nucleotide-disulfide oxidoreductase domain-containing protein 1 isoform X1 [Diorhabda sublineata]|uniref:pyridine nucleotide-disulfide oxidoreductase domain-containing protein 1 isoform X1 n=1 Tax=Diorhabda sublineata TaxID=1163346 RepID=UPI0024E071D6|nr:pyridine nucleotide-disulfide oxidoreductase domain-containing protein 1 isoform X1 [Diorhabda sublineata]
MEATFVIVGGGIAGVSCAETLAFFEPDKSIILLSESSLIKTVINLHAITRTLTQFNIQEMESSEFSLKHPNITVIHDTLVEINDGEHYILTSTNKTIKYEYLCLCTGAQPKLIPQAELFEEIIGIRDTDSVEIFLQKINRAKKVAIVGNGGIASELAYKIKNTQVHWIIKDKHISATFVEPGAAEFFLSSLNKDVQEEQVTKRMRYQEEYSHRSGAALGPDWYKNLIIKGAGDLNIPSEIKIHYETEISNIQRSNNSPYALEVTLSNGDKFTCDMIISATGVTARKSFVSKNELELSNTGEIKVNEFMQTNLQNVYAAGDVCCANWKLAKHWFQMKLWTQARQMGSYAAKAMVGHLNNEEVLQDFCFEMFAHSTKLFGYKVILLGLFNGQKLGTNYEILIRMTKGLEYIKFVLEDNKLQGAVLIGDTDLEEMAENLILNQIDLSPYGDDILNPDIDIEDYFD